MEREAIACPAPVAGAEEDDALRRRTGGSTGVQMQKGKYGDGVRSEADLVGRFNTFFARQRGPASSSWFCGRFPSPLSSVALTGRALSLFWFLEVMRESFGGLLVKEKEAGCGQ